MQAHQVTTNSSDNISTSYPSPESYSMIFIIATLISLSSVYLQFFSTEMLLIRVEILRDLKVPK